MLALITYFPQPPQASKLFLMTVYGSAGYAYIGFSAYCFLLLMAHRNTPWGLQAVIASGATAALCAAIAATALCFISLFGQSSSLLCLPSGVALLAAPLFLQRLALRRRREMGDAW
ncbi:MAG: hypothetical protein SF028_05015 [Candidatus Sumerlaeia bacterium]|nr:hypothetical protein [Candidatus Sumerlaeia bacterium]